VASYGMISQEPGTTLDLSTGKDPYLDFDIVAKALGCNYGDDAEAELNCMRMLSWVQIEEYINRYQGTPGISFMEYIRAFPFSILQILNQASKRLTDMQNSGRKVHFLQRDIALSRWKSSQGPSYPLFRCSRNCGR
jgi:hypothetical protein